MQTTVPPPAAPSAKPPPPVGTGRWTKQEDEQLRAAVKSVGAKSWRQISVDFLGGKRTDVQCLHRWTKVLKPGLVKGPWLEQEDATILRCIEDGMVRWSNIAECIPGRLGKQCRERWSNHLDPTLKKGGWTDAEDSVLVGAQAILGNRWCEIARLLPGRSENSAKNRWNSAMRRNFAKDGKVKAPKEAIVALIKHHLPDEAAEILLTIERYASEMVDGKKSPHDKENATGVPGAAGGTGPCRAPVRAIK